MDAFLHPFLFTRHKERTGAEWNPSPTEARLRAVGTRSIRVPEFLLGAFVIRKRQEMRTRRACRLRPIVFIRHKERTGTQWNPSLPKRALRAVAAN